ncbi:hypothetical protein FHW67_002758 [Herbaspirillum sp. Sphag1AN]|nr:hypothetical protein [Herbaspirillum sp. Sphag1AN]
MKLGPSVLLACVMLLPMRSAVAQQANLEKLEQAPLQQAQPRQQSTLTLEQHNTAEVQRHIQRDLVRRQNDAHLATLTTRRQVQQSLQQGATEEALQAEEEVATAGTGIATLAAASSTPAGVDERPLWNLLRARRISQFDQSLAQWRKRYPAWTPSAQLLAERARQQQEFEIDTVLTQAKVETLTQLVQRYPAQFSCERIDRLWRAAEIFAKAGHKEQAMALYRSLFPDCEPAANRVASLYMAQQNLGQSSDALGQLIALEAQAGDRDVESERQFVRLQYDRDLSRLVMLEPASDAALLLVQQLSAGITAYHDSGAATLSGWVMLAHDDPKTAQIRFQDGLDWSATNVDALLGLLQIRLDAKDIAGAEALLAQPLLAAEPRARLLRSRLKLLQAEILNQQKDFAASLRSLDEAEQWGATAAQTEALRGWDNYGLGRYAQASSLFATQYRRTQEPASAEGWALSESAQGNLRQLQALPEAQSNPLRDYVLALQSQQLYYRKQFIDAYALQKEVTQGLLPPVTTSSAALAAVPVGTVQTSPAATYLPTTLGGIDAASVSSGWVFSDHAGTDGQGHLTTLASTVRGEWIDGTRQINLRWRQLLLDAGTVSTSTVAHALGVPADAQSSGKASAEEFRLAIDDSLWLTRFGRLSWQLSVAAITGGAGGTDVNGNLRVSQQTGWGSWSAYMGSNPVTDSLLSWRGMQLSGSGQIWGDVRRNTIGASALWQVSPDWSLSANVALDQLAGENVQSNKAVALDLGAGYHLKLDGFDYFNLGPALHYLHYDNNQNQYDWGLGGYYSPQRSLSVGVASQFLSVEGRDRQWSGNLELGFNQASQAAASCLPVAYGAVNAGTVNCGYSGSDASGPYGHLQLAMVQQLGRRWQLGAQGDLNVTPGRDRQYGVMLFLRYFFSDRDAVLSRDLPKDMRDFYGQFDGGR